MRFIDTSFWFALQDGLDRRHGEASAIARQGIGKAVTTPGVLGETWTLLRRRMGHTIAVGFLDRVARISTLEIVGAGERAERDAWVWLRRHDERPYSFVDAVSFAVMRSRRIREALAFDGDFAAAGFIEVRAP
jgi:predicted nucleic acid-binding protein